MMRWVLLAIGLTAFGSWVHGHDGGEAETKTPFETVKAAEGDRNAAEAASASPATSEELTEDATTEAADLLVVVGAPGDARFEAEFRDALERWREVAEQAGVPLQIVASDFAETASDDGANDYERLRAAIARLNEKTDQPLWLAFIGHGTFAGDIAKFNLSGPDVSARELAEWVKGMQRPLVIVNGASASGPFINRLSMPQRIIVTATRSGQEQNYARFGEYFAEAIGDLDADLDHDHAVSVLEAFLHAASATQQFYESEGRLATEHPLLDDNGDGLGTPPDFYRGVRAVKSPAGEAEVDGETARRFSLFVRPGVAPLTAEQRAERDRLEQQLETLRDRKEELGPSDYYKAFNEIALQLAQLYEAVEKSSSPAAQQEAEGS